MYNRILVPTDGSELSDKALEAAADFAKALGSSIVIITVIEPYSYTNLSEYRPESIDQYDSRVKEMAQERLEIARELVEKKDINCEVVAFNSKSSDSFQDSRHGLQMITGKRLCLSLFANPESNLESEYTE